MTRAYPVESPVDQAKQNPNKLTQPPLTAFQKARKALDEAERRSQ